MASFWRRPSASPAISSMLAMGIVTRRTRVVVIGCGAGEDAIAIAAAGAAWVRGIDVDPDLLEIAAEERRKAIGAGLRAPSLTFRQADATSSLEHMRAASVHMVIDTLASTMIAWNDDDDERECRERRLVDAIARVLRPRGMWIAHGRADHESAYMPTHWEDALPEAAYAHFRVSRVYPTHLAEYRTEAMRRVYAGAVFVGIATKMKTRKSSAGRRAKAP